MYLISSLLAEGKSYSPLDSFFVLIIGIIILFFVLFLIMGIVYALRFFKEKEIAKKIAPHEITIESDDEIVAAITVAISIYMEGESSTEVSAPFIIKKIIRK